MKNNKGFTLTEILATLAIIGVIIAIAIPSFNLLSEKFGTCKYCRRKIENKSFKG